MPKYYFNRGRMLSFFWNKTLSEPEFAKMMRSRLIKAGLTTSLRFDEADFCLTDDDKRSIFLGNIYEHYTQSKGGQRKRHLERFIQGMINVDLNEMPANLVSARSRLMPVVRERMLFEGILLRSKDDNANHMAFQPWIGNLCLAVAYDAPDTIGMVGREDLKKWEITLEEGLSIGKHNLGLLTIPMFLSPQEGVFIAAWDDDYDSSRLLLPHLWNGLNADGNIVAICTNRNRVFATGENSNQGLKAILELAQQSLQEPRAMRPLPIVLRSDRWELFEYNGDDPELFASFKMLSMQTSAGEYSEQKALLDKKFEANNTDIFVASFNATRNTDSGVLSSYCVWTIGIECFLPKTDQVAIVDPERGEEDGFLGTVDWKTVVELPNVKFEVMEYYPLRYRPIGRPTDEFLDRLA